MMIYKIFLSSGFGLLIKRFIQCCSSVNYFFRHLDVVWGVLTLVSFVTEASVVWEDDQWMVQMQLIQVKITYDE